MAYRDLSNQDELVDGLCVSRVCKVCKIRKPFENFHICSDRKNRRRTCKTCEDDRRKARPENPFSKDKKRENYLRINYGITIVEFDTLWTAQLGLCAICKSPMSLGGGVNTPLKVQVDHCHKTNKVRGLLCFACNTGIGKLKDSVELLLSAIEYLENPPEILYRDKNLNAEEKFEAYKNNAKKRVTFTSTDVPLATRELTHGFTEREKGMIREEYSSGKVSQTYLAIRWSASQSSISNIVKVEVKV